jgi:hypothetical protein
MDDKAASVEGVSDEICDHGLPIRLCSACRIPGNDLMQADEDSWAVQSDFEPADDGSDEDDETQQPTPSQGSGERELPPLEFDEWWKGYLSNRTIDPFPTEAAHINAKQAAWAAWHYPKAALAANADLERRVNDWESTLSMAGCWKDKSVPVGWVNKRAEVAEAANADLKLENESLGKKLLEHSEILAAEYERGLEDAANWHEKQGRYLNDTTSQLSRTGQHDAALRNEEKAEQHFRCSHSIRALKSEGK